MASSTLKFTTEVNRLGIQQDSGAVVYIPRELSVAIEDSGSLRLEVSGNLVQLLPFSGFDFTIDGGSVYVSLTTLVADLNNFFAPSTSGGNPYPGSDYATSTKQSDGTQKTKIVDGSGNVVGSTGNALDVNIKTPTTLPVSVASLPLPSGAATEAKQDAEAILIGAINETAPGTDTASSGLNGRLQRIAQRITSLISALGSPFQAGGSIGNTSFGSTVADGANVVEGALADAIVSAGATGSISAKLRRVTQGLEDLKTLIVLAAGTNIIGKVGIDQTTPGTTDRVTTNVDKLGGTAVAVNSGNKDNGTLRVVLATNQPALSTDLPVKLNSTALGTTITGLVELCYQAPGSFTSIRSAAALTGSYVVTSATQVTGRRYVILQIVFSGSATYTGSLIMIPEVSMDNSTWYTWMQNFKATGSNGVTDSQTTFSSVGNTRTIKLEVDAYVASYGTTLPPGNLLAVIECGGFNWIRFNCRAGGAEATGIVNAAAPPGTLPTVQISAAIG